MSLLERDPTREMSENVNPLPSPIFCSSLNDLVGKKNSTWHWRYRRVGPWHRLRQRRRGHQGVQLKEGSSNHSDAESGRVRPRLRGVRNGSATEADDTHEELTE